MTAEQLKNIIEAALMTSNGTMNLNQLVALFEKNPDQPERTEIRTALEQLQQDYEGRGIELKELASGYRIQVRMQYAEWVNRLFDERPQRYSRALLETLAIIAYRQPITRGEIEDIRGVSISSSIIKTLQEREWIRIVGHRDVPGKPELLASTRQFLDYFNLKKLSELPSLAEIKDFDKINPDLFEGMGPETGSSAIRNADPDQDSGEIDDMADLDPEQQEFLTPGDEDDEEMDVVSGNNVVPFSS